MNDDILFFRINELLSEWNPIGLPKELADVEYSDYVRQIISKLKYKESIKDYLITILEDINSKDIIIQNRDILDDLNKLANQIEEIHRV